MAAVTVGVAEAATEAGATKPGAGLKPLSWAVNPAVHARAGPVQSQTKMPVCATGRLAPFHLTSSNLSAGFYFWGVRGGGAAGRRIKLGRHWSPMALSASAARAMATGRLGVEDVRRCRVLFLFLTVLENPRV